MKVRVRVRVQVQVQVRVERHAGIVSNVGEREHHPIQEYSCSRNPISFVLRPGSFLRHLYTGFSVNSICLPSSFDLLSANLLLKSSKSPWLTGLNARNGKKRGRMTKEPAKANEKENDDDD